MWLNLHTSNILEKESTNIKNFEKWSILNIFDEPFIIICRGLLFCNQGLGLFLNDFFFFALDFEIGEELEN
jgi:hypothetical protein